MHGLKGMFYRPTLNLQDMIPAFIGLLIVLIVLVCIWALYSLYRAQRAKSLSWKRFVVLAKRFSFTRQEFSILRKLAHSSQLSNPSRLLSSEDHFERVAHVLEKNGRRYEKRLVRGIRRKLFDRTLQPAGTKMTTDSIPGGTRLLIKYLKEPDTVFWGHLVDNDKQGLIVIVPSNREIRTPLRLNTHLEITAYIPDGEPLVFVTWIKSVIPGPRKMVILGHSDFAVYEQELKNGVRLAGPQYLTPKRSTKSYNLITRSNKTPSRVVHA